MVNNLINCRMKNVSSTTFHLFMEEPPLYDQSHTKEWVSYIVFESGRNVLTNGQIDEAGKKSTNTVTWSGGNYVRDTINFSVPFNNAPAVLHSLNTYNNALFLASTA